MPGLIQPPIAPGSLPGPIAKMLDGITSTILNDFTDYPPHTIQRLAELVLRPKQHYRSLTGYLHALDRVVHVTSGSNIYPLPPTFFSMGDASTVSNGEDAASGTALGTALLPTSNSSMDDEEALGGALLTPIPWLSSQPNGAGDSEDGMGSEDGSIDSPVSTRSDPAMTQASPPPQQQSSPSRNPSANNSPRPQIRTDNTETIEGPNGTGTIETVSVSMVNGVPTMTSTSTSSTSNNNNTVLASRGVTQGELLRQEQRAGVVPLTQLVRQQQQEARAQAEMNHNNNDNNNNNEDTDSPMGNNEPELDVEMPHARGPDAIDDADIGPQRASTSHSAVYTIGTTPEGAAIQMQSIDIEAAVGRHIDGTPLEEPRRTSPEHEVETTVPQSPKRDAEDDIEVTASKKQKTDTEEGALTDQKEGGEIVGEDDVQKEGEDTVMVAADVPSVPNGEAETPNDGQAEEAKDEKDAEGDTVIRDLDPTEASAETGKEADKDKDVQMAEQKELKTEGSD